MLDNEISFHIQGEAGLFIYEHRIILNNLKLEIGINSNKLEYVYLISDLSLIDLNLLSKYFEALNYYNNEKSIYRFTMKNEIMNIYSNEFIALDSSDISDYIKIGDGLCFKLENYYCLGTAEKEFLN